MTAVNDRKHRTDLPLTVSDVRARERFGQCSPLCLSPCCLALAFVHVAPSFPGSLWTGQRCCLRSLCLSLLSTLGETAIRIHCHISLSRRNFHTHNLIFLFYVTWHKFSHTGDIASIHHSPVAGTQNMTSRTWRMRGLIWHMTQWLQSMSMDPVHG